VGEGVVFVGAASEYRWISFFLVLSLWPSMVAAVPSQANVAAERMAFNTAGSLASYVVNIAAVAISLLWGWDLLGIAVGVLAFRSVDCAIRLFLVWRLVRRFPAAALPADLKRKMTTFSGYSLTLMILNMIVWDRSDVIFLRALGHDTAQIAFFSVALSLIDKIQTIPSAFGSAANATILAQYGRDRRELPKVVSHALWYSFACSVPLLLGLAAISSQLVPFLYGARYVPAVPVLVAAALLAIPKCLAAPGWSIMEAHARQGFLVIWLILCAIVNVLLDVLLIPRFGAMGAAIANGIAQLLFTVGLIGRAHHLFGLNFRLADATRLLFGAGVMAIVVLAMASRFTVWWAMAVEAVVGTAIFVVCMRVAGVLRGDDRQRLLLLEAFLPAPLRSSFARMVLFVAP
jgi:O-antigen/teichoic acid export membrane protein